MKKLIKFCLIALFIPAIIIGQSYQGPSDGSVNSGVTVNTNNYSKEAEEQLPEFKLFNHLKPEVKPNPKDLTEPTGSEGSNVIKFKTSRAMSSEDVDLFQSFEGIPETFSIPPDPYLAAGPNHLIMVVNSRFRITDKEGNTIKTILANNWYYSLLSEVSAFDPKVIYDNHSDRWVMVWLHVNSTSSEGYYLVSVSDDSNPVGEWYNWKLPSHTNGNSFAGNWGDYQGVGYDDKAIYLTSNQFSFSGYYDYTKVRIIDKSDLYESNAPGEVNFTDLWNIGYPTGDASTFGIRPVRMQTTSDEYYLVAVSPYTTKTSFGLFTITNPLSNPQLAGVSIPVVQYSEPPDPEQLGGGYPQIDGGGTNLRNEPVYTNGKIYLTHSVKNGSYSNVRFLEIDPDNNNAVTDISLGGSPYYHTYPAVAVNANNDVVLTYSRSSEDDYMGAFYSVLPLGNAQPGENLTLQEGNGNYVQTYGGGLNRWGDYNGAWVDPSNMSDFWVYSEYVHSTNDWGTWVGGVRLPNSPSTGPNWTQVITVSDAGDISDELTFGQNEEATDGLDQSLGETELPPLPPSGVFDARMLLPTSPAIGSSIDIRNSSELSSQWILKFQPGEGGYPFTISWDSDLLPAGDFYLKDVVTGSIVNENMKEQNEVIVNNEAINKLKIVYYKVKFGMDINITDQSGAKASETLKLGVSDLGSDGVDDQLGEFELPPLPPSGVFDARFNLPTDPSVGSLMDIRNSAEESIIWEMNLQAGSNGYPLYLSWEPSDLPLGSFILKDAVTGTIVNIDMKENTSYTLENSNISKLQIEYSKNINVNFSVDAGWNIMSVPVNADDMAVNSLFPTAVSSAFSFQQGYSVEDSLKNGTAYWLKFDNQQSISLTGSKVTGNVPVNSGWNLVGAYDKPVAVSDINTIPAGIIGSSVFGFQSGYFDEDTLKAGKGYWVKVSQEGELSYNSIRKQGGSNEERLSRAEAEIAFMVSDGVGGNDTLVVGQDPSATDGLDASLGEVELPPLPPGGVFDTRLILPDDTPSPVDIREGGMTFESGTEFEVNWQLGEGSEGFMLEWSLPGDVSMTMQDLLGGAVVDSTFMPGAGSYTVTNENLDALKLTFDGVVPVELSGFTANSLGESVRLEWITATEKNNSGFEVQRSEDNQSFEKIRFVDGHGTTTQRKEYSFVDNSVQSGTYYYRLKQIDLDGSHEYSDVVEVDMEVPQDFALDQNYPNPFNPGTTIKFALPVKSEVSIRLFNALGQEIRELVSRNYSAGTHELNLNASSLSSGIYFYSLKAAGKDGTTFFKTRKMILMK